MPERFQKKNIALFYSTSNTSFNTIYQPQGLEPLVGILDIWEPSFSFSLENDGLNSLRNNLSVDDIRSSNVLCIKSGIEVKLLTFRVKSLKEHHLQAKF